MLALYSFYSDTVGHFRGALAASARIPMAAADAQLFYLSLGFLAAGLKALADLVSLIAGAPDQRWSVTVLLAVVPLVLGYLSRATDLEKPGFAAKTLKFIWSFEFCRALLLFLCGSVGGAKGFAAATTILGVPAPDTVIGIPVFLPVWFLSGARQKAAAELYFELGAPFFYTLFAILPGYVLISRIVLWLGSRRPGGKITTRSAFIAAGILLLTLTVAARNGDLSRVGPLSGYEHPIDKRLHACREPLDEHKDLARVTSCLNAAAEEWESEIEKLTAQISGQLAKTGNKQAFLKEAQRWKVSNAKALAAYERGLEDNGSKRFKLAEARVDAAKRRATNDLQRLLKD